MSVPYIHIHCKTLISSLFASHVYSPYSIQIDNKPSVDIQIPFFWRKLCLNQYEEQIRCMSNANTRTSSLALSGVNKLCRRYPECQAPKHELFEVD